MKSRTRLVYLIALPLFMSSRVAQALLIRDSHDDFQFEWKPVGANVCAVGKLVNDSTPRCQGEDLEFLKSLLPNCEDSLYLAMVTQGDFRHLLTYSVMALGKNYVEQEQANRFARETFSQFQMSGAKYGNLVELVRPESPAELKSFGGAKTIFMALRHRSLDLDEQSATVNHSYTIMGHTVAHQLDLAVDEANAEPVRKEFESALSGVRIKPLDPKGRTKGLVGRLIGLAGVAAMAALALAFRRSRNRVRAEQTKGHRSEAP